MTAFTLLTTLSVKLRKRILVSLIVSLTITIDIYSSIDGFTERILRSHSLPGNVKSSAMVRTGTHHRKTGSEIVAIITGKRLKRSQTLIMIHRKHCIKMHIVARAKEAISSIRTKARNTFLGQFCYHWSYYFLFFLPQETVITCMRIE